MFEDLPRSTGSLETSRRPYPGKKIPRSKYPFPVPGSTTLPTELGGLPIGRMGSGVSRVQKFGPYLSSGWFGCGWGKGQTLGLDQEDRREEVLVLE